MQDIIGLDLDSVLCNTAFAIDKFIREEFDVIIDWENEVEEYWIEKLPGINLEKANKIRESIYNGDIVSNVAAYNYAEHSTKKLHNEGFTIAIITSRPSKLRGLTMDWLDENNIVYDLLYFIDSLKKYELVQELEIKAFVEDRFDILESILENCGALDYGLYSVFQHWNKRYSNELIVPVRDVAEAVDRIIDYRKWRGFFLTKCQGNIEKFIKEYQDGKGQM